MNKDETKSKYWFPARQYGWIWGNPSCWQGWAVFIGYFVALLVGAIFMVSPNDMSLFVLWVFIVSIALVLIFWLKGEPPSWR